MDACAPTPGRIGDPVVYLLDVNSDVLEGIADALTGAGLKSVRSATSAEFFDVFEPDDLSCLVLDLALGDADGLAVQREICDRGLTIPVVFLAGAGDVIKSVRAMKAGALDCLTLPVDCFALLAAVRSAIALDLVRKESAAAENALRFKLGKLTAREREVLPFLVSGLLNKQIAVEFGVVEKTIKVHRAHIVAKLGTRSIADLVRFTERMGIPPLHVRSGARAVVQGSS